MQNEVKLLSITPDYMTLLKTAASQCYQIDATDKVIDHIIDAGHLSVLEHCSATFKLSCSIQMLLQLTRHRHLSFTVQSSRGSEMKDIYKTGDNLIDNYAINARLDYRDSVEYYNKPRELAAYTLPKATMYNLVVTGNFRAWYEYLSKRLCQRAQKEHREVAQRIWILLQEAAPKVFCRKILNCVHCKEKGCKFSEY